MRVLLKINRYSGCLLFVLLALYFVTGFGSIKGFMDPVLAKSLHNRWLFFPTLTLLLFHAWFGLRGALKKRVQSRIFADIYLIIFAVVLLAIGIYLYFL